jgi:lysozyme
MWIDVATPFIKEFESCSLTAYHGAADRPGLWSIGWGQTGPDIVEGTVWTQDQCDLCLAADINSLGDEVDGLVSVPINENQKAALVSFVYNLGVASLQHSTLLAMLNASNYLGAALQIPLWNHANGAIVPGLTRRRTAECALFQTVVVADSGVS